MFDNVSVNDRGRCYCVPQVSAYHLRIILLLLLLLLLLQIRWTSELSQIYIYKECRVCVSFSFSHSFERWMVECVWVCMSFVVVYAIVCCYCCVFVQWTKENTSIVIHIRLEKIYRCCATNQHSFLIAKLIVMIMIINIIFVSEWHFAVVSILVFARDERENEGKKRQVPSEKG